MKKLLKTIALSLALTLIFPLLVSCSEKDKNGIADSESILSCGSREISYGLYKYFFLNYKDNYKKEDLENDSEAVYAEITDDCLKSLSGVYGVVTLCEQYGIYTTDADIKEKVNATIDSICEQNINEENDKTGIKGYRKQLAANYMTEDILRFILSVDYAEEKLFIKMTGEGGVINSDDATVRLALEEEFIRVLQVYINTSETDRSYEECKALAEKIAKQAKDGADFDALVANNSNDYTMTRDGYYMPRGWMEAEFEDVAFSLGIGESSDVLELGDGFHIIKRYECEDEYIEKNYDMLRERYLTCKFYQIVDEHTKNISITKGESFSAIAPDKIAFN